MSAILPLPAYTDEHLASLGLAELIVLLIAGEDRVPRNLIDECARRGAVMAERLGALPDEEHYWAGTTTRGEWWLLLHAVMILGLIPGERAGLSLVNFMRRMAQADDHNLQDWLAGYWPALFLNKPQSVLSPLRALCADRRLDWYIRANALDAVVAGAQQQGDEHLEQALAELAVQATDEEEDWELRLSAGNILLDFPRAPYRPLLEGLAARQTGWGVHFSQNDIEHAYSATEDEPEWTRFKDPWAFYAPAAIENRQRRWQEEDADPGDDEADDEWDDFDLFPDEASPPYFRPTPKTGRNDPCPCGSGKKYKKCCLPADG